MIDSISFRNYKSFKDETSIELKPITILVGPNSSGKSSILKLLGLLYQSYHESKKEHELGVFFRFEGSVGNFGTFKSLTHRLNESDLIFSLSDKSNKVTFTVNKELKSIEVETLNNGNKLVFTKREENENMLYLNSIEKSASLRYTGLQFHDFVGMEKPEGLNFIESFLKLMKVLPPLRPDPKRYYTEDQIHREYLLYKRGDANIEMINHDLSTLNIKSKLTRENFYDSLGNTLYSIVLEGEKSDSKQNIVDVGFGFSQLIPILTSIHLSEGNISGEHQKFTVVIEQPELHLHPALQSKLSSVFWNSMVKPSTRLTRKQILLETHSEHLVRGFQVLIAQGKMKPEDIAVYYVDKNKKGNSFVKKMEIDERGYFTEEWPTGFFDTSYLQSMELLKAQK